ncbi:MAG: NAD-dependent epimerase/dehydratase family protein [Nitrospinota bacterium]
MNSAMVTGATGFIGSHITEKLLGEGVSTNIFARKKSSNSDFLEKKGAKVYIGGQDREKTLKEAMRGIDTVIHCAGSTTALNEKAYASSNVDLTSEILGLLTKEQKFLFISSQAAAGPSPAENPLSEQDPPKPLTLYGKSKLLAETRVKAWGADNEGRFTILRPSIVYGPREKNLLNLFKLGNKGLFFRFGKRKSGFSMVHVDDLVEAVSLVTNSPFSGETYFVSNDKGSSWDELENCIKKALKKRFLFSVTIPHSFAWCIAFFFELTSFLTRKPGLVSFEKAAEVGHSFWLCSNQKIKSNLNWTPLLSLEEGFTKTAAWYGRERWI